MAEEKLISVSVQIPASELSRLAELMDRVLRVMEEDGGARPGPAAAPAAVERGSSAAFDPARFEALGRAATYQAGATQAASALEDSRSPQVSAPLPEGSGEGSKDEATTVSPALSKPDRRFQEERGAVRLPGTAGTPRSDAPGTAFVPAARISQELPAPFSRQTEELGRGPTAFIQQAEQAPAPSAGFPAEAVTNIPLAEQFSETERIAATGTAPLTAQDLSLAFQRDDRRYDNGFPLY